MWEVASSVITHPPVVISSRPSLTNLFTTIFFVGWALKIQRSANERGARGDPHGLTRPSNFRTNNPALDPGSGSDQPCEFIHFRAWRAFPLVCRTIFLFIYTRAIRVANHIYRRRISTGLDLRDLCVRVLCTTYITFPIRRWFPHYVVYVGHKAATDSTCYTSLTPYIYTSPFTCSLFSPVTSTSV